jgi:hypothetical protein
MICSCLLRLLWSLDYEPESRLVLVGCKPSPLAAHIVLELTPMQLESGPTVACKYEEHEFRIPRDITKKDPITV